MPAALAPLARRLDALALPQTLGGEAISQWLLRIAVSKRTLWWVVVVESLILLFTVVVPFLMWMGTAILGKAIKDGIECFDRTVLGVDVEIGRITPDLLFGILDIDNLVVKNPEGKGYTSDYLLKAARVHIDIEMMKLFLSGFKTIVVEKVEFDDVDIIYEKGWTSANIKDVLYHLSGKDSSEGKSDDEKAAQKEKPKGVDTTDESERVELVLMSVLVRDVGARVQARMLGGRGLRVAIADISYRDFSKEVGSSMVSDIVKILLKSILKTALANVLGKEFGDRCM